MANPRVFFDLVSSRRQQKLILDLQTMGGEAAGRVVMELFNDKAPKTADNFRVGTAMKTFLSC